MKQRKNIVWKPLCFLLCIIFAFSIAPQQKVMAYTIKDAQYIYDDAGLLTESEISQLNNYLTQVNSKNKIHTFILTAEGRQGYSTNDYADQFIGACDRSGFFGEDSVVLLIDLVNRDVAISGYGNCELYIDSSRGDTIIEDITPDLTAGKYYEAINSYIKSVDHYMNTDPYIFQVWFQLLAALILASIIVAIMAFSRGSHVTTNSNTYLDQEHSKLRFHHDNYIRTTVTKVRKPQNNSSSSSGGGSGRSHSHSSGKF